MKTHLLKRGTWQRLLSNLLRPLATTEDEKRREFILNVLLLGSIVLSFIAVLLVTQDSLADTGHRINGVPLLVMTAVFGFFVSLYLFSRFRHHRLSAIVFVAFYLVIGFFLITHWGIILAQGWIVFSLAVTMAAVLIGPGFAGIVFMTIVVGTFLVTFLTSKGFIQPQLYWLEQSGYYNDAIGYSFTLGIITLISWLSNREITKSLKRARNSEALLKKERDQLEARVEQRTRELLKAQRAESRQLHSFAQFGHLAKDLIHDLINPLTSASLDLKTLNNQQRTGLVSRAVRSIEVMERYIESARKQVQQNQSVRLFYPSAEMSLVKEVLSGRARKNKTEVRLVVDKKLQILGTPIRFHKIVVNLLANGIDACAHKNGRRLVTIALTKTNGQIKLIVKDTGVGIAPSNVNKLFTPFFTTKDSQEGMGIGLVIVREIVEHDLKGTVEVKSLPGRGTTVTVTTPEIIRKA